MRLGFVLVVVMGVSASTVAAQSLALTPGQRVRLTAPSLGIERQPAVVEERRGDALVVAADSAMSIPVTSLTRLEVYQGRHGHFWKGAGIGFLAGAVAGALLGPLLAECPSYGCDTSPAVQGAVGGVVFGVAGGVVGGVLGAFARSDRWEEVPLGQLGLRAVPRHDGFGIAVGARF